MLSELVSVSRNPLLVLSVTFRVERNSSRVGIYAERNSSRVGIALSVLLSLTEMSKGVILQIPMTQSYPPRALDRTLQEDWARDAREGPRVLMSLRVDFGPMV